VAALSSSHPGLASEPVPHLRALFGCQDESDLLLDLDPPGKPRRLRLDQLFLEGGDLRRVRRFGIQRLLQLPVQSGLG
jgi:hypothetical protein